MLDIQFIRDNPEMVAQKSAEKGYQVDITQLLGFDTERRELLTEVENLRRARNELTAQSKGGKPTDEILEKGRQLRDQLADLEHRLEAIEKQYHELMSTVPNIPLEDVPVGASEDENQVVKKVGEPTSFDFEPKSHSVIAEAKDWIDKERAAKVAGSRFAYLKGDLALLQFAIINFTIQKLGDQSLIEHLIKDNNLILLPKAFTPVLPPALIRTEPYEASARLNAQEDTYQLAHDDLWLNASAEHSLCTMYWNEILPADQLPIRYIGYSTSFRREAGSYGKDTEGIFRMHQFDKLEMEVFSTPDTGLDEHKLLIAIQEYLVQQLGLPYTLIQKCTADIGKPNASGYDIDTWMPAQSNYRETHTADYMTDYQARDLKTRTRLTDGSIVLVHTNDATAFALGRILIAIIENNQTAEGNVIVPEVLVPFMGGKTQI